MGKAGVYCIKKLLPALREQEQIDFVIANGDGATGGYGIGKNHSIYLHKLGIDVITGGECVYYKKDMVDHIAKSPYILRPANYPQGNPGLGWHVYETGPHKVGVISLLGLAGFSNAHLQNPFLLVPHIVERIAQQTKHIIVDFHAATTAEKQAMFYHLAGTVSAVIGSHTKVLTADERVLPTGTAVITDAGRTGSMRSIGGLDPEIEIRKYLTQIREYSKDTWDGLELQGVLLDMGADGRAGLIKRVRIAHDEGSNDD